MISRSNGLDKSSTWTSTIEAASCFRPSPHYAPPPRYSSSCPAQQFATGRPHYPRPQHCNRELVQHLTRTPPQHLKPSPQRATLEDHINHHAPPLTNLSLRPPQHLSSTPTRQSVRPKDQRNHQFCRQHTITPSKRQKRDELGVSDDQQEDDSDNCKKPPTWAWWETQNYVYKPEANEDPFKYSRSFRHQQPANSHHKRDDNDDHSNKTPDDAQDDDDDSDLGEEHSNGSVRTEREETAYKELLPKVKRLVSELGGVNENWIHDREKKMCIVCNIPTRLKGWKALLQHAESFQKRKRVQHRALFRVLSELLKKEAFNLAGEAKSVLLENSKATEEVIVWPPVIIIDNMGEDEYLDKCLPKLKPSDIQRTFRFHKRGPPGVERTLVVFPASEVGHLNSKMLVDSLAKLVAPVLNCSRGPESPHNRLSPLPLPPTHIQDHQQGFGPGSNRQVKMARDSPPLAQLNAPSCDQQHGQLWTMASTIAEQQQQQPRRVFLAQAADMELMDPQRKLLQWSIQNKREILKCVLKKSKEEHELEKAKVKAKRVEVDHIAESHQRFKSRKAVLSQQLKDAEMALKAQKGREEQIAKQHAEHLRVMDNKFKEEVRRLEIERVNKEARIRQLLEENERQLEKERVERSKEVDSLLKHLENVNQELRDHTARKALEKEREIARKRGEIFKEISRREAKFNEETRNLERNLLEQQESEKMKFLEEYNKIRQEFLDEWMAKQAASKGKAELAPQHEKELLVKLAETKNEAAKRQLGTAECSICFEEFDDKNKRALMQPCGHAKTCLPCAAEIFSRSKLCPICRVKISSKPKAIPYKLFM